MAAASGFHASGQQVELRGAVFVKPNCCPIFKNKQKNKT